MKLEKRLAKVLSVVHTIEREIHSHLRGVYFKLLKEGYKIIERK